jgi:hypothetical protein
MLSVFNLASRFSSVIKKAVRTVIAERIAKSKKKKK